MSLAFNHAFSQPRLARLPASVTPTNGTSLSEESRASPQQLVMARQGSYDPLRSHF